MPAIGAPELIILSLLGLVAIVVVVVVIVVAVGRRGKLAAEQLRQMQAQAQQQPPTLPPGAPQGNYDAFPEPPGPQDVEQPVDRRPPPTTR